jgi:hypothetical protein
MPIERALAALPANNQDDRQIITFSQELGRTYRVFRLGIDTENGAGFAAIGGTATDEIVPETLIADIGQALAETRKADRRDLQPRYYDMSLGAGRWSFLMTRQ